MVRAEGTRRIMRPSFSEMSPLEHIMGALEAPAGQQPLTTGPVARHSFSFKPCDHLLPNNRLTAA